MQDKIVTGVATALATTAILGFVELTTSWFSKLLTQSPLPQGMIVMTDQECGKLDGGWEVYEAAAGRFPIAAGFGDDGREERSFSRGTTGGEYNHVLTGPEMPAHAHSFQGEKTVTYGWAREGITRTHIAVGDASAWGEYTPGGTIGSSGGGDAHNNMPPYFVFNFCIKQ
jgi:hypothetical protein